MNHRDLCLYIRYLSRGPKPAGEISGLVQCFYCYCEIGLRIRIEWKDNEHIGMDESGALPKEGCGVNFHGLGDTVTKKAGLKE